MTEGMVKISQESEGQSSQTSHDIPSSMSTSYTTIQQNSKSSTNSVLQAIQIQPFHLALTAHQYWKCIHLWGNCQDEKQVPATVASGSTHKEMVTRHSRRETQSPTLFLHCITRYHIQKKQESSEAPTSSRCSSQRRYTQQCTSCIHSTKQMQMYKSPTDPLSEQYPNTTHSQEL